jgi:hypothetical protein
MRRAMLTLDYFATFVTSEDAGPSPLSPDIGSVDCV